MIRLKNNKNQKINEIKFIEILFYTFPLSFIVGNLSLNIHLLLFIVVSLLVIKREQLTFSFKKSYWLLISFFLYIFLSTTIQFQSPGLLNEATKNWEFESNPTFKSFALIRFLIFVFVIDILFFNKILKLKNLFLISLICTSFVSFDVILQYITGFDLFGYKSFGDKNPGPFGDEWIAGSYLQKFSFFSIFYIVEISKNMKFKNTLLISIITLHLTGLILAGNRMPLILFLFACILIIIFIKKLRIAMTASLVIFSVIFFLVIKSDLKIRTIYHTFYTNTFGQIDFSKIVEKRKINKNKVLTQAEKEAGFMLRTTGHGSLFRTTIEIWKEQPLLGFGLKSFRVKCYEVLLKDERQVSDEYTTAAATKFTCGTHSHNYYLELLLEGGIIGAGLIIIFFIILLKDSFYILKKYNQRINSELTLILPIVIVVFLEIWPLKSSGSFFTTWNATFIWLSVALLIATTTKKLH